MIIIDHIWRRPILILLSDKPIFVCNPHTAFLKPGQYQITSTYGTSFGSVHLSEGHIVNQANPNANLQQTMLRPLTLARLPMNPSRPATQPLGHRKKKHGDVDFIASFPLVIPLFLSNV